GAGGEKKELPAEEKNNKLPSVADPTDPPLPAKGVLTPADMKGADLPVVAVDHSIDPNREELLKKAEKAFAAKDFSGAEMLVLQALENVRENSAFYRKAWKVLTSYRVSSLYGKSGSRWSVQYRIRPGDSLSGIASRYRTTVELIRKMNNISGSRIYVGRSLWLTPGDWRITVSKASRLLKLYHIGNDKKETLWGVWEIGIGRMGKTPSAEFAIASRVRHPDWYLPDGRVFKYGEPENQLGEYFLKLAPVSSPGRPLLGYGIHGSQDESTVGRSLSNGCVRMRNADVEAVFYLVPNGTRVVISDK
ncbi:MAG: L,D-transpeptidase family protein, partial [Lentisphaeria bacterium]|nr:L,D-transpeptidase family protein [Lentisphaeria bacterium]